MVSNKVIVFSREGAVLKANRLMDIRRKRSFGMGEGEAMNDLVPIIQHAKIVTDRGDNEMVYYSPS